MRIMLSILVYLITFSWSASGFAEGLPQQKVLVEPQVIFQETRALNPDNYRIIWRHSKLWVLAATRSGEKNTLPPCSLPKGQHTLTAEMVSVLDPNTVLSSDQVTITIADDCERDYGDQ